MSRTFNNVQNKEIDHNGKKIFLSRSVAVVGIHIAQSLKGTYVLVEKRSEIMDQPHTWALPGGYLDWNESTYEAMIRETYEETSWYFPDSDIKFSNGNQPIFINSEPGLDPKQNVSLIYLFIHNCIDGLPDIEDFTSPEVDEVKWLNVIDFKHEMEFMDPKNWAFNHDGRIRQALRNYGHLIG